MSGLRGGKVLVTGPTGQVAEPVTRALAVDNEVWGLARFRDDTARARLESAGVHCVAGNLATDDLQGLPRDFTHVCNFAVAKSGAFDRDLAVNAESVLLLMAHCRDAAFLHCSSTAVYEPNGPHPFVETDPLGDHHRNLMPTYSVSKIAGEAVTRAGARALGVPTAIARLNVPYGDRGGWPAFHLEQILAGTPIEVRDDDPCTYNPIHEDDLVAQVPRLLERATTPATIVNWAGPDVVRLEEWCRYLGTVVGVSPSFVASDTALRSAAVDTTRMRELIGPARVSWRDGMRRMVAARHPELELHEVA